MRDRVERHERDAVVRSTSKRGERTRGLVGSLAQRREIERTITQDHGRFIRYRFRVLR
jgi:hypothetical protein